jgi:polar amino acid transport system permease protein
VITWVLAMVLGLLVAVLRLWKNPLSRVLNPILMAYIDFFRTTPPLVQLIWVYYALPVLIGLRLSDLQSIILTFTLNTGAFAAEIFRAGIQSIDPGQMHAAKVVGMSYFQAMRRIILPQAILRVLPPLGSTTISLVKFTSFASVIAFPELLHRGRDLAAITFRPLEILTVVAVIYFVMTYPLSWLVLWLEKRGGVGEHMY